jgi:hypothetical protein
MAKRHDLACNLFRGDLKALKSNLYNIKFMEYGNVIALFVIAFWIQFCHLTMK